MICTRMHIVLVIEHGFDKTDCVSRKLFPGMYFASSVNRSQFNFLCLVFNFTDALSWRL